jgi:hypothetical protein
MSKKNFIIFLLLITYTLILGHNLVPHRHEAEAATTAHQTADHHHHDHAHPNGGHEDADKPNQDPDHFLSNHQHPFADNKIHHPDTRPTVKLSKQAYPVLVCLLTIQYHLFHLPEKIPDPPAYQFPPTHFPNRSHALRGPPVA